MSYKKNTSIHKEYIPIRFVGPTDKNESLDKLEYQLVDINTDALGNLPYHI